MGGVGIHFPIPLPNTAFFFLSSQTLLNPYNLLLIGRAISNVVFYVLAWALIFHYVFVRSQNPYGFFVYFVADLDELYRSFELQMLFFFFWWFEFLDGFFQSAISVHWWDSVAGLQHFSARWIRDASLFMDFLLFYCANCNQIPVHGVNRTEKGNHCYSESDPLVSEMNGMIC